jgi:hypothetical protein
MKLLPFLIATGVSFLARVTAFSAYDSNIGWDLLGGTTQTNRTSPVTFWTHSTFGTPGNFSIAATLTNESEFSGDTGPVLSGSNWSTGGIDLTKYFSLAITPAAGVQVDFGYLQLPLWRETQVGDTGPNLWEVRSSLDNYAARIGSVADIGSAGYAAPAKQIFDLSSLPNVSSAITFRIYGYGATNATGSAGVRAIQDKVFTEANAVPEPVSGLLLGLGVTGFLAMSRRRPRCAVLSSQC